MTMETYGLMTKLSNDVVSSCLSDMFAKPQLEISYHIADGNSSTSELAHFKSIKTNRAKDFAGGLFYPPAALTTLLIKRGKVKKGEAENYVEHLFYADYDFEKTVLFFCETKPLDKNIFNITKQDILEIFRFCLCELLIEHGIDDAKLKKAETIISSHKLKQIMKEIKGNKRFYTLDKAKFRIEKVSKAEREGTVVNILNHCELANPRPYTKEEATFLVERAYETFNQIDHFDIKFDKEKAEKGTYVDKGLYFALEDLSETQSITFQRKKAKGEEKRTITAGRKAQLDIKLNLEEVTDVKDDMRAARKAALRKIGEMSQNIRWQMDPENMPKTFAEEMVSVFKDYEE